MGATHSRHCEMATPPPAGEASVGAKAIPVRPGTEKELPNIRDLAITPGGLHFLGTTPGGTRIIYDRNTLLHYRQSPLSKTPPADFPVIPGVTTPGEAIPEEGECSDGSDAETPTAASIVPGEEAVDGGVDGDDGDDSVFPME